jgi:rhamnose transport system ATP-binding protein
MTVQSPAVPVANHAASPILSLEGVHKSFPGVHALKGVSFDVRPGEVHALLGENGAGKSTLIKVMAGVHAPDAGTIAVDGTSATFANPDDARRAGVATIYQELLLFPELTVTENVVMGNTPRTRLGTIDWAKAAETTKSLLTSLDIADMDVSAVVGTLSVGNRQRVEILRALSKDARVLIMDEPTAALTEHDVQRLFDIVRRLRARGVGIVYISHRMDEIFALADRVTVLRDGDYVGTRDVAATNSDELVQMMVGRHIEALFPKVTVPIGAPVLELSHVSRRPATRDVSLTVRAGEILGLAGLVGSGRSELAQVVFGVTPAESGEIRLAGRPVTIASPGAAQRLGIAYVPEDRGTQGLVRAMTVRENFSMAILSRLATAGVIDREAERSLAQDGIRRFGVRTSGIEQVVGKLSGGNQQKVVLGKWLATEPKLLILDEPTRGIDVGAKAEIHRLMGELAGRGLAILMISSELPEVLGMSDRVLVMREGRIAAEFDRAAATPQVVGAAMMGDAYSTRRGAA